MLRIAINKDTALVNEIRQKLKENEGYCPCALVHEPDTKCMCKDFKDKIAKGNLGECHCGLYVIEENSVDD